MIENETINTILYELNCNEYEFIKNVIMEMNNLGFYTVVSQPGNKRIYYDDKKKKIIDRRQRSYVRGYLKPDLALYLIEEFNNNTNIFIRSSIHNKILNPKITCTCGSVEFNDNNPCTLDFDSGDFSQSFNFNLPLRRPFLTNKQYYDFLINITTDVDDLIEFDILDLRFEKNEMWIELLNKIKKYLSLTQVT